MADSLKSKREALKLIQEAQTSLEKAAESICSVPGLGDVWSEIMDTRQGVHSVWNKLEDMPVGEGYDEPNY